MAADVTQTCHLVRCGRVTPPGARSANVRGRGVLAINHDRICIQLARENDILECLLSVALFGVGFYILLEFGPEYPALWPLWWVVGLLTVGPLLLYTGLVINALPVVLRLNLSTPLGPLSRWLRRTVLLKAGPGRGRIWLHPKRGIVCLEMEDGRWLAVRAAHPSAATLARDLADLYHRAPRPRRPADA